MAPLTSLLFKDPAAFFVLAGLLLYSVIAHEVAHGAAALAFGDDTARRRGRLTLNPLSHLDPIGSLMLFLVGFGWARPVPVDYRRLKNTRIGFICVALAGCAANILIAAAAVYLLQSGHAAGRPLLSTVLHITARVNLILGAFNLIPIPPLDGSKVVMGFLPEERWGDFARFEPYGFGILLLLLVTGLLEPVILLLQRLILLLISAWI